MQLLQHVHMVVTNLLAPAKHTASACTGAPLAGQRGCETTPWVPCRDAHQYTFQFVVGVSRHSGSEKTSYN